MQVFMWTARVLVVIGLLALAHDTFAHHEGGHRALVKGVWSKVPVSINMCDDEETAKAVFNTFKEQGNDMAFEHYTMFTPETCGRMVAHINPYRLVAEATHDGQKMQLWEVAVVSQGVVVPVPIYMFSFLPVYDSIEEMKKGCDNCLPA